MLLESRLNDKTTLLIDCESVGGIDKNAPGGNAQPDRVMEYAVELIKNTASHIGHGISVEQLPAPVMMEIEFGIRIDSNAVVALAQNPNSGQIRVRMRWDA